MKKILLAIGVICSAGLSAQVVVSDTFLYTGAMQTYTVSACVTSVTITAYGAQGENQSPGGTGGLGGMATGVLNVTTGQILNVFVGGQNTGYNGGGTGAINGNDASTGPLGYAGHGGGASDVRVGGTAVSDRVIVAGGGGGAGHNGVWSGCQVAGPAGNGGAGGGLTGGIGTVGVGTPCNCGGGGGDYGTGGTQVAGGIHGNYAGSANCLRASWTAGQDGTLAQGGNGSLTYYNGTGGGGGGGGGYYGGGAGGSGSDTTPGGGGGGGSSWTGTLTSAATTAGVKSGNGIIIISYSISSALPAAPTNFSGPSALCPATMMTYTIDTVAGATSYNWTAPSGWTITSGQGTTSVTVVVGFNTDTLWANAINACGSGPASYTVVTVYPYPTLELGPDIINCGPVVLTADTAVSYSWTGGFTTQSITVSSTGTYVVTITDVNGCTNADYLHVTVNPNPTVVASAAMNFVCVSDDTVQLFGSPSGGGFSGPGVIPGDQFDPTAAGVGVHDVVYMYTDSNGCSGMDTTTITVDICLGMTINANTQFSIHPNPATSSCNLTFNTDQDDVRIEITDVQGRVIQTQNESAVRAGVPVTVDLDNISAGTYLLHVISGGHEAVQKLQVQ